MKLKFFKKKNKKMNYQFYKIQTTLSYGRSPVKIQPKTKYDSLEVITMDSLLVEHNTFEKSSGTYWYDFVQFSNSFDFVISDKVKNEFEKNKITGYSSFPIIIDGFEDKKYFGIAISSKSGPILNLEKLNNYIDENALFDLKTWDGSDIFNIEATGIMACSEKVKKIILENKFSNVEIKEL
jgi:hypothetical protein